MPKFTYYPEMEEEFEVRGFVKNEKITLKRPKKNNW